jgi:hypothetical protein
MRKILSIIAIISCFIPLHADVTAVFNWSDPSTLNPAYQGPTADNRYGDYISNVVFSDNGVTLQVSDNDVKEGSQKARFLYGYVTQVIEMRAYPNSEIIITAPTDMCVHKVEFEGAKADENYLISESDDSTFANGTWTAGSDSRVAEFYIDATINCTKITVQCIAGTGVDNVVADSADQAAAQWYTIDGKILSKQPTLSGLYIKRIGNTAKTILIR